MSSSKQPKKKLLFKDTNANALREVVTVTDAVAEKVSFETVDFSDPNRPKVCLEVDFPILQVNEISAIETNATKPIYMNGKWFARRMSSVFRQLLISAATKAPNDEQGAAQLSWSLMYHKNHRTHRRFANLKVVDIFMGGGTTVIEAARLGFDVTGNDLNPVAWWVVKNRTCPVASDNLRAFGKYISEEVKPQLLPFFAAKSPRKLGGKWIEKNTGKEVDIDIVGISPSERKCFDWVGPEVVYTFWLKHIMCSDPTCFHITPQSTSSVFAEKTLKIKTWTNCVCSGCGEIFDLEEGDFRMAPTAKFQLTDQNTSYAPISMDGGVTCPHCRKKLSHNWVTAFCERMGRPTSKEVTHYLLLSKVWLKGTTAPSKIAFGGFHGASEEADALWFRERTRKLGLIEVRGEVPEELEHSNFGKKKKKDSNEETSSGNLICGKCGRSQDILESIKLTGHCAREFPYAIQGFDPQAKSLGIPYGGRFFDIPDLDKTVAVYREQRLRKDLQPFVPKSEIPFGHSTHERNDIFSQGYTHWQKMFNPRQIYVHSLIIKTIHDAPESVASNDLKSEAISAVQNYLRQNCMFSFWNRKYDKHAAFLSNNNYHSKASPIETGVFNELGAGTFLSCLENVAAGLDFAANPYDLRLSTPGEKGKSTKQASNDGLANADIRLLCQSSTNLAKTIDDLSVDLVITDPPFGNNINYSELADFFLVWIQKPLSKLFPEFFQSVESPKRLEAVSNRARHPGENESGLLNADVEYDRLLTLCWQESFRILKPGGLLIFTFHHDKDVAWIGVLESLFKAGFIIECTFPIRSDSTQGAGEFGAKKIEFDIVHVCRKRNTSPEGIYWATLRKRITESVDSKKILLEQHHRAGLGNADLEVMIRGEVLEQYSKHYGKVKKNLAGDQMSVQEILIAASEIARQLLVGEQTNRLPDSVSPITSIYFSLFRDGTKIEFNQAKMRLKGCGISLEELVTLGWVEIAREEGKKFASLVPPENRWDYLRRKKLLNTDLDQVHFALNCFMSHSKDGEDRPALDTWVEKNFENLFPSVVPLLKFLKGNNLGRQYSLQIDPAIRAIEKGIANAKDGYKGPKDLIA